MIHGRAMPPFGFCFEMRLSCTGWYLIAPRPSHGNMSGSERRSNRCVLVSFLLDSSPPSVPFHDARANGTSNALQVGGVWVALLPDVGSYCRFFFVKTAQ